MQDFAVRYTAAWCGQVPAAVAAHFAPEGSLQVNDGPPAVGRDAITAVAQGFMSAFPDLHLRLDALIEEPIGFRYCWTLTGHHRATGNRVAISGYEQWVISPEGLIATSLGHFDAADYDRQTNGTGARP